MTIEIMLSGFLFLFIIITNIASDRYGHETFSDLNSEAKLKKINNDPKNFKISVVLAITEHISIVILAIMLFIAFRKYNIILSVVWTISRSGEGIIQIFDKKSYWKLQDLARQYEGTGGAEKDVVIDIGNKILKTKNTRFTSAQVLFSIGTLSYSLLFVRYGIISPIIGWFGIIASILYGLGNGIKLVKSNSIVLWSIGGLLVLIFEMVLVGRLLFYPLLTYI